MTMAASTAGAREKLVHTDEDGVHGFKSCYAGRSIADDLAEQGYVVIVIDMFYWGERRMRLRDDPVDDDAGRSSMPRGPLEPLVVAA